MFMFEQGSPLLIILFGVELTKLIKEKAKELGFAACGICDANSLEQHQPNYLRQLKRGHIGEMGYLERNLEKRFNPGLLHAGTESIIVLALNYYPEKLQRKDSYQIAKYAYGKDYHELIKNKLRVLLESMQERMPGLEGRAFTDSAPVLERVLAQKAGLGWIGRNGLLIIPRAGSFFFLGELFVNKVLDYDEPYRGYGCGNCMRCIEACPNGAIVGDAQVDARPCISYLTIEKKSPLMPVEQKSLRGHLYGCDICQDVCPWNRWASPTREKWFQPDERLLTFNKQQWQAMDKEQYCEIFRKSAVKRRKYEGLKENMGINITKQ